MKHINKFFLLLLVLSSLRSVRGYAAQSCEHVKPVVIVHGILADKSKMKPFVEKLKILCPNLYVLDAEVNTEGLGRLTTLGNLRFLLRRLQEEIHQRPQLKNGFHLIGQSLGGVLSRYYVQEQKRSVESDAIPEEFRVHKLVTWATPHRGVYGLPGQSDRGRLPQITAQVFWKLAYLPWFQKVSSIAELWNDPAHESEYFGNSQILPRLNNEIPHPRFNQYRENIKSLDEFVVFQSLQDEVIHPRESSSFDYFFRGFHDGPIERYEDSSYFKHDVLGIKSLTVDGKFRKEYVNCAHPDFPRDPRVHDLTLRILGVTPTHFLLSERHPEEEKIPAEYLMISGDVAVSREVRDRELKKSLDHFAEVHSVLAHQKEYYEEIRPTQFPLIRYEKEMQLAQDRVDLLRVIADTERE